MPNGASLITVLVLLDPLGNVPPFLSLTERQDQRADRRVCALHWNDGRGAAHPLHASHVYRREAGEWKVVHEHSDFQLTGQTPPANS